MPRQPLFVGGVALVVARVVQDCVWGSSVPAHDAALDAMEYLQTGARRTTAEILAAFDELGAPAPTSIDAALRQTQGATT